VSARPVARRIDDVDPEGLFLAGPARDRHAFWLDAGPRADSGWSWLGVGEPVASRPRHISLGSRTSDVPGGFGGGWVGWAAYDDGALQAGAPAMRDDLAPQVAGLLVRRFVALDHATDQAWLIAPEDEWADAEDEIARWRAQVGSAAARTAPQPPRVASARHRPDEYGALIERCRDRIRAGDAYQLCLTTRFEVAASDAPIDPVETYLRLRGSLPTHHGGYIRVGEHALLSASPEQFLHVADGIVRTRPIKGTRLRAGDPIADEALARDLVESPKERAENVMIVDLMRNDLQRVCEPGTVAAERLLEVESYPAVHQLVSTVAGRLLPGITVDDLFDAAFPAGSMTGAPKLSAMTILNGLEGAPRGVYAGCFGWIGDDGRADLAMTIRSIVVHPGGAYVGAGGGITWLSAADAEVDEVAVKARGPLAALGAVLPDGW
jgi:para-aminobenzoate synthetase component 1